MQDVTTTLCALSLPRLFSSPEDVEMKLAFCGLVFNVSFQVFAESVTELFDLTKRYDCFDLIG